MLKKLVLLLAGLLVSASSFAVGHAGDYAPGDTIDCNFGTVRPSTGASYTLAGTPAVSVYKDNSTTESTAGVTLSADFDSRTGLNHLRVTTASDGTFYSSGSYFEAVITTGTVDSVSVVGQPVCSFTLNKEVALRPATAGRTLVVDPAGLADANTVKVGPTGSGTAQTARDLGAGVLVATGGITEGSFSNAAGSFDALGWTRQSTAAGASSTTVTLDAGAPFGDNTIVGGTLWVKGSTNGNYWQSCGITAYVASTKVATVSCPSGFVTPTGTISFKLAGTTPASGGSGLDAAGVRAALGMSSANLDAQLGAIDDYVDTEVAAIKTKTDFLPSATAGASGGVFIAGTNAATTVTTALTTTFTGNLTGNVGGNVTGSVGSVAAGGITAASVAADAIGASELAADAAAEVATAVTTTQGILTGTCDSGSTTTCVDDALTQAAASQLEDRLICFSDSWCGLITTFNPAADTATTTKVAPATRSGLTYTIFPSTTQ